MIALISFTESLYMTKAEAQSLKLKYESVGDTRIGYKDDKLQYMYNSGTYYADELRYDAATDGYYDNDKKVRTYDVYTRPPEADYVQVQRDNQLVDLDWFIEVCPYRFTIEQHVKQTPPTVENIQVLLGLIEQKTLAVNKTLDVMKQSTLNQKCDVHVGGGLIATYNDLMLKEDSCTDELQTELNNGWRIIAVCVQPNQRRPDYILGRYNPKLDTYDKQRADR